MQEQDLWVHKNASSSVLATSFLFKLVGLGYEQRFPQD